MGSSLKQQRISLDLNNVSGLFVILSFGLMISIFIVIMEFYIRSQQLKKKNKNIIDCSNF